MNEDQCDAFKGRHFTAEVILWALRGYLAFLVSYRDLSLMLSDRGVRVDHTTIFCCCAANATFQTRGILLAFRLGSQ
jgi:hypothetical protein